MQYILLTTFQQVYSFMWLYSALYPFWGQKPKRNKRMIPKLLWRISISQASIHFSSENIKKHKSSHICSWDRSMTFTVKNVGHLKQYSYHSKVNISRNGIYGYPKIQKTLTTWTKNSPKWKCTLHSSN